MPRRNGKWSSHGTQRRQWMSRRRRKQQGIAKEARNAAQERR